MSLAPIGAVTPLGAVTPIGPSLRDTAGMERRDTTGIETLEITCPRCGQAAAVDYYGPCDGCRAELRASQGTAGTAAAAVEYEPKMNVTPNAVALKDD